MIMVQTSQRAGKQRQSPGRSRLHQQVAAALGAQHQGQPDARDRHWTGASGAGTREGAGRGGRHALTAARDCPVVGSGRWQRDRRLGAGRHTPPLHCQRGANAAALEPQARAGRHL